MSLKKIWKILSLPIGYRKRDRDLRQLIIQKPQDITSQDLLNIEYGAGFLESQGARKLPDYNISIKPIQQDKTSGFFDKILLHIICMGYVYGKQRYAMDSQWDEKKIEKEDHSKKDNDIFINRLIFSSPGNALGAFLSYSITSSIANTIATTMSLTKILTNNIALTLSALSTARTAMLAQIAQLPVRSFMDVVGHEHIHILQREKKLNGYEPLEGTLRASLDEIFKESKNIRRIDTLCSIFISKYLRHDAEVQARLHTVIAHGSKRWGKIPMNKVQLWAALDESGITLPDSIKAEISDPLKLQFYQASSFQRNKNDLKSSFYRTARKLFVPEVAELDSAGRAWIAGDAKDAFWRQAVPFMYGHLLELYNISHGRARMGFEDSINQKTKLPGVIRPDRIYILKHDYGIELGL